MSVTLAIDTSTRTGRIAVAAGETVVFAAQFGSERSHNSEIFAPLQSALAASGRRLRRIVVGTGPGSYTGVRIGIAAGLGISMAKGIPIAGLRSIDFAAAAKPGELHTVIGDARRGKFFVAHIDGSGGTPALVEDVSKIGGPLSTFDAEPPSDAACPTHPSAARMAVQASLLAEEAFAALAAIPPEPIYLSAPFITQSVKPGKAVPKP